jgi:hypothetical protein
MYGDIGNYWLVNQEYGLGGPISKICSKRVKICKRTKETKTM